MRRLPVLTLVLAVLTLAALPGIALGESYGAGVTLAETTSIAKILADPDAYVGKTVRIEGRVLEVCPKKGCWMELSEDPEGKRPARLRVKVEDDVIVFPVTAEGKLAVAEGVVEAIPMTREQYTGWLAHLAEERGEKLDPATVGEGPFRILQIRGTGARIEAR